TPRLIKKALQRSQYRKAVEALCSQNKKMCSEPPCLPTSAETLATKNSGQSQNTRKDAINGFLPITSHERKKLKFTDDDVSVFSRVNTSYTGTARRLSKVIALTVWLTG
ncbi:hypothetical protein, partial [Salmonella enterica]|uniref:hypothetical protein n=1 Tax=Salmonella enterica TaxID=28901 RepID=UPI001C998711